MNGFSSSRGSALLIVLGMLTFMLFSGLAFSVYMRETRLPSSFLRRTSATRQLAKAALALAIDDIDKAINDNPHPGVGTGTQDGGRCNTWNHRVFFGVTNVNDAVSEGDTVATLTLEGLAYLPPSLINEARYYSRHTPTATWRPLHFDAGRYAYCAIDVSDYFDVNRIRADLPRSSASGSRVSFAHLFEKSGTGEGLEHTFPPDQSGVDKWEQLFEQARTITGEDTISFEGKVPFVSLADLNLAMGKDAFGPVASPFCKWLAADKRNEPGFYYEDLDGVEESRQCYRAMTFVTDGWYPRSAAEVTERDQELSLADGRVQPFSAQFTKDGANLNMDSVIMPLQDMRNNRIGQFLPLVGRMALCDYLDEDSVPISLALPTQEKTPMVCALGMAMANSSLKVMSVVDENISGASDTERTMKRTYSYHLDGNSLLGPMLVLKPLVLYPFRHHDGDDTGIYEVDGAVKIFLSRCGQDNDVPLVGASGATELNLGSDAQMTKHVADGVITVPFKADSSIKVKDSSSTDPDQAVQDSLYEIPALGGTVTVQFDSSSFDLFNNHNFLKVTRTWKQTKPEGGDWSPAEPNWDDLSDVADGDIECDLPFLTKNGSPNNNKGDLRGLMTSGEKLKLNVAVWVRLKKDGKVVDLAPCSFKDDAAQKGCSPTTMLSNQVMEPKLGGGSYLLKVPLAPDGAELFDCGCIPLNPKELNERAKNETATQLKLLQNMLVVVDPRYNHDPESWLAVNGSLENLKTDWLNVARPVYSNRDGDPFMAVSNQGYLQSVYELAHLPRTVRGRVIDCEAFPLGDENNGVYEDRSNKTGTPETGDLQRPVGRTVVASDWGNEGSGVRNGELMWRTYDSYDRGDGVDDFEGLQLTAGDGGVKVCPYGPANDTETLMAAFANTPYGWFASSTNENPTVNPAIDLSVSEFNELYAWNNYHDGKPNGGKISWADLRSIALEFRKRMLEGGGDRDWIDVYNEMWDNGGGGNTLMGVTLDSGVSGPFFSPDRKFLHGFWRECFAVRQQLFLVFVRVEPMMMGGGIAGFAPPQLGARAVALVWRDPTSSSGRSSSGSSSNVRLPHRTRVLFYHPLD